MTSGGTSIVNSASASDGLTGFGAMVNINDIGVLGRPIQTTTRLRNQDLSRSLVEAAMLYAIFSQCSVSN
jgi:hypothetical protein